MDSANPTLPEIESDFSDDSFDEDIAEVASARRSDSVRRAVEWAIVVGGALIVALIIKTFLVQAFFIPSESMVPTLEKGDRVLVNKLSYDLHDVHRGDLIVFKRPSNAPGTIDDLIKRVIGLPGDVIYATPEGDLVVNDHILVEPYLSEGTFTDNLPRTVIPEDKVFVMGDNRNGSQDSRVFGPIFIDDIVGRAFVKVWPPGSLSGL